MYACMHVWMHAWMYICIHVHICMLACMHACMHTQVPTTVSRSTWWTDAVQEANACHVYCIFLEYVASPAPFICIYIFS